MTIKYMATKYDHTGRKINQMARPSKFYIKRDFCLKIYHLATLIEKPKDLGFAPRF
jgi:hypothetical protein